MLLEVKEYNEKVLRKKAKFITAIDDELRTLVVNMFETCYKSDGIGLAAPQVGVSKRLFILSVPVETGEENEEESEEENDESISREDYFEEAFVNPEIISKEGNVVGEEGCLSIPDVYADVERAETITVKYFNLDGEEKELKTDGLIAKAIQHENDHLDGVLFVDRLPMLKKGLMKKKLDKKYGVK